MNYFSSYRSMYLNHSNKLTLMVKMLKNLKSLHCLYLTILIPSSENIKLETYFYKQLATQTKSFKLFCFGMINTLIYFGLAQWLFVEVKTNNIKNLPWWANTRSQILSNYNNWKIKIRVHFLTKGIFFNVRSSIRLKK